MPQPTPKPDEKASESESDQLRKSLDNAEKRIKNVYQSIGELKGTHKSLRKTFDELEKSSKSKIEYYKKKYTGLRNDRDKNGFAVVLIDGDGTNFLEEFVRDGVTGGRRAAAELTNELRSQPDWQMDTILVRVYANIGLNSDGLASRYANLPHVTADNLRNFVIGFNSHIHCDFVDSGAARGIAHGKLVGMTTPSMNISITRTVAKYLQENFNLYINNWHCKEIVFAGSHNRNYAPFLTPYMNRAQLRTDLRITLLRGQPFVPEMQNLVESFHGPLVFRRVFRSQRLV